MKKEAVKKVVYFATGAPERAAADLKRLLPVGEPVSLRVIVPAGAARQMEQLAELRPGQVFVYNDFSAPLLWLRLWLRLWMFLGLSGMSDTIFLKSPGQVRLLKILAMALPGRLIFSDGIKSSPSCSRFQLLWVSLGRALAGNGPVCVVASASSAYLEPIVAAVRKLYPGVRLHGLLPASADERLAVWFDSFERLERPSLLAYFRLLRRCAGKGRFQAVVLPCTTEKFTSLKWLAWWFPVWNLAIYNENADAFSGHNLYFLIRHCLWRMRNQRSLRRQQREHLLAHREMLRKSRPVGVLGSASAYYLENIIPAVRARFPGAKLHGLLPRSLAYPAGGLFDATTIIKPGFGALWQAWKVSRAAGPFQAWIVPYTDEPYTDMKILAALVPLTRRHIYNELADGFPLRDWRAFYRHLAWRARDHLSFQIVAGASGKWPIVRLLHLFFYALRLAAGVPLLLQARLRSYLHRKSDYPAHSSAGRRATVDLIYLDCGAAEENSFETPYSDRHRAEVRLTLKARGLGGLDQINEAIRTSEAEFICLMDSRARMLDGDWLDRLLDTFDERTAQVGPQILNPLDHTYIRGMLLGGKGAPRWNSDIAVCWSRRPDWLAVDVLPWGCVLIRRSVFQQVGYFREGRERESMWVDLDFCRRLSAHGWHSICNQSVTATQPAINGALETMPRLEVSKSVGVSRTIEVSPAHGFPENQN